MARRATVPPDSGLRSYVAPGEVRELAELIDSPQDAVALDAELDERFGLTVPTAICRTADGLAPFKEDWRADVEGSLAALVSELAARRQGKPFEGRTCPACGEPPHWHGLYCWRCDSVRDAEVAEMLAEAES